MARASGPRPDVLAEELRQAIRELVRRVRAASTEQGISWPQMSVLKHLDHGGSMTTAALARAEHVKPQSMGATLAQLEEEGLVKRAPDPTDGRRWDVSLTAEGRRVLTSGRAQRQAWLAQAIEEKLDASERRTLQEALALVRRLYEP